MLASFSRDFRKRFRQINFIYYYIAFFEYGNIRHASTRKKIQKTELYQKLICRKEVYKRKKTGYPEVKSM